MGIVVDGRGNLAPPWRYYRKLHCLAVGIDYHIGYIRNNAGHHKAVYHLVEVVEQEVGR